LLACWRWPTSKPSACRTRRRRHHERAVHGQDAVRRDRTRHPQRRQTNAAHPPLRQHVRPPTSRWGDPHRLHRRTPSLPQGIGSTKNVTGDTHTATQQDPTLATLFGSQDYCETDDCTSVLSPAAYLCDLLLWLRNHQQGTETALDVLDSRRPDIRHLLLNCPNSDTELPYEDLVIELLADAISPPVDAIATSYVQTGLLDGMTYYYVVTAVNAVGEGAPSAQVSAQPQAPTAIPAAPTGVSTTPGDGQVTLTWASEAGAASYNVYWSTTSGVTPGGANVTKVAAATAPYVQTGLVNGDDYYYVVTAVNALGESGPSAQAVGSPVVPTAVPAAPTGVVATAGDTQVTISWDPVADATSYNVYWSTSSGVSPATGSALPTNAASFLQAALIDGTTYYYVVTAANALGEGAPSTQVSATPAAATAAPAAPSGVTAVAGDGEVTISWDPVAGATNYPKTSDPGRGRLVRGLGSTGPGLHRGLGSADERCLWQSDSGLVWVGVG
jgi:fibronectin type 3 domain-containing protein